MEYSSIQFGTNDDMNSQSNKSTIGFPGVINVVTGIFLLVLAVSGNFIAETLGCKSQKLLSENMYAKNIIIILIVYFALGVTDEENTRPEENMIMALQIWMFFLIFNKMNLYFTGLSLLLITTVLIGKNYIDYYKKNNKNNEHDEKIEFIGKVSRNIFTVNIGVIIIGFLMYFRKQFNDHSADFSFISFIFGKTQCNSMK
jgi:hypothetical protein